MTEEYRCISCGELITGPKVAKIQGENNYLHPEDAGAPTTDSCYFSEFMKRTQPLAIDIIDNPTHTTTE